MDFFDHQDDARRRSRMLVVYFILSIIGIIAALYAAFMVGQGLFGGGGPVPQGYGERSALSAVWDPGMLMSVSGVTLAVILLGSGFKTMQLAGGGSVVARDLGGRKLDPNTTDTDERRLLNVVEEMAIASGIPAPDVYVLDDEDAINAFAAGREISDAVVGVTKGCLRRLSRDELQGVIAHEFSHIINGDMKLNMRIVGLLFGILVISIIGQYMMRAILHRGRYYRSSNREEGGITVAIGAAGFALFVVGYIGVFFGHLIKAAVSRQREFLADASAVQYTRNPDGIANALKKIGGLSQQGALSHPRAEEASHMFFANGLRGSVRNLFASHPDLPKRIQRIQKDWDGKFPKQSQPEISRGWKKGEEHRERRKSHRQRKDNDEGFFGHGAVLGEVMAAGFNGPTHGEVSYAHEVHEGFPEDWVEHVHHPTGSQAIVFALLDPRGSDSTVLCEQADEETLEEVTRLQGQLADATSTQKLALIDLALPSLRHLSPEEADRFLAICHGLIEDDGIVDLFEFTLQKVLRRHLQQCFGRTAPAKIRFRSLKPLANEASILLSALAGLGAIEGNAADATTAFAAGIEDLAMSGVNLTLLPPEACGLSEIDRALDRLDHASPQAKRQFLNACGRVVMADGVFEGEEAELIRAIADTLGCPMPPFVKVAA